MKHIILGLSLAIAVGLARPAGADPARHFSQTRTYTACHASLAFACGRRDGAGNTYGTAHTQRRCERYEFRPDGSATVPDGVLSSPARYRIVGKQIQIETLDERGKVIGRSSLGLAADGTIQPL